jgi:hypothetical protein
MKSSETRGVRCEGLDLLLLSSDNTPYRAELPLTR